MKINQEAIQQFVKTLDLEKFRKKSEPIGFPLKFDTIEQEINFWAILDLLNFGSGFRVPLNQLTGRGASNTIRYGLFGMQIGGKELDADLMSQFDVGSIGDLFGIPLSREEEVQAAITILKPTELRPLADMITTVLNDSGNLLRKHGCKDFATFILRALESEQTAAKLVESLVTVFPAFNDAATYYGQEVFLLKKAQLLAADLHRKFKDDPRFNFPDIKDLTVFTDNVLPAVLRKLGILELSESLSKTIDEGTVLPVGDQEVELRALAIVACDMIVSKAKEHFPEETNFDAMTLDYYLWTVGKDPEYRSSHRHYTRDTLFY